MTGADIGAAFGHFATSRDPSNVWFKGRERETTGPDLHTPPYGPMSAIVSDHQA